MGRTDAELRASYEVCRRLAAQHGRTYYLATLLLPPIKRPFVHALYAFARCADDIVDQSSADPSRELASWRTEFFAELRAGRSAHPVRRAVVDTVLRWEIPQAHFEAFLDSMAADLTVDHYETYDDLYRYMYGSAAVIGLQMLPILEAADQATPFAEALGVAFQLANFVRDVGEDLDRGRIYLPLADLDRFGVTPRELQARRLTSGIRAALAYQIARVRRLERYSRPGIAMVHPACRDCLDTARVLYCGLTDAVEGTGYDVFHQRAVVSRRRRLAVAGPAAARAVAARHAHGQGSVPG